MTDLDLDDIEVLDDDTDANFVRVHRSNWEQVREAANRQGKTRKELETLQRERAISDAGLGDLAVGQLEAVTTLVKEQSADAYKAKAVELGFIAAPPAPEVPSAEELAEHAAAAAVANGAGAPKSHLLTLADAAGWSAETKNRFAATYPDLAASLARGQEITRPAGFAA